MDKLNEKISKLAEEEKDVLGFLEQYLSFTHYLNKTNQFKGDFKHFLKTANLDYNKIKGELRTGWFASRRLKSKLIYDFCYYYNKEFQNLNWINSMNSMEEAYTIFKKLKNKKIKQAMTELILYKNTLTIKFPFLCWRGFIIIVCRVLGIDIFVKVRE